ncbi:hypothetical protein SDJN03_11899, partial [Cucurbita argyrosperma subsp. sororia]
MDNDDIVFLMAPIMIMVFSFGGFSLFVVTLCCKWRELQKMNNGGAVYGGGAGKIIIVVDQNGNPIGGTNFPAGCGNVGSLNIGGEFRYDRIYGGGPEVVVPTVGEVMKCQSCSSCGCTHGGSAGVDSVDSVTQETVAGGAVGGEGNMQSSKVKLRHKKKIGRRRQGSLVES